MGLHILGLSLLTLILFLFFFNSISKKAAFNFLPSLTWFAIMVLPYLLNVFWIEQSYSSSQAIGISIIFVFMILGDLLGVRRRAAILEISSIEVFTNRWFMPLSLLIIAIPLIHFSYAGQIPIFNMDWNSPRTNQLAENREDFSKLASYPYVFKLLENYYFTLIAPLVLALAVKAKYFKMFILLLVLSSFFAVASGAEFTIFMMLFLFCLVTLFAVKPNYAKILALTSISILTIIVGCGILLESKLMTNSNNCDQKILKYESIPDRYRICKESEVTLVNPLIDRIGYRVYLTPIEVSSWWYNYYQSKKDRSLESLFNRELQSQPSNIIGNLAYFDRFPGSYLKSISAYSSVDADSHSFGWFFVWLTGLTLFIMRIGSYIGLASRHFVNRSFGAILFGSLIVLPFTASIQAILIAQGMFVPLLAVYLSCFKSRFFTGNRLNI